MSGTLPRLKRRSDFVRLTRTGKHAVTPRLVLQCAPRPEDVAGSRPRVGFTASRKVGRAVTRNRARRRLRALADRVIAVQADASRDYVLVARHATAAARFDDLTADLERALGRLGALKPAPRPPAS